MSLKRIPFLLIPVCMICAAGLFIACGKSSSGPKNAPTPSVLTAVASANEVALSWTRCPDEDFFSYTLYRLTMDMFLSYVAGIAGDTLSAEKLGILTLPDVLSFNDYTLEQTTAYYALRTTNAAGLSVWSNEEVVVLGGYIVAWGENDDGQCDVPSPNSGFIAVSGGVDHSLGLRNDGSIAAWGTTYCGQCDIPDPNTGFIAVAAGHSYSLGLRTDGSIAAWGRNDSGQCDVPSPNSGFKAVAAGWFHSLGLRDDGSIVAWGTNYYGQCDIPDPNTGFIAVAGGGIGPWGNGHSLGLRDDGSIAAWGWNECGQCDVPSPNSGFTAIAAGGLHSLGLKE